MAALGRVVVEALQLHYGRDEVLRRLAHPFWFQSLGCVMGMDWHSSGITTSVVGALKRGLEPVADELGLHVCGGRGKHSRRTPEELHAVAERRALDGDGLARTSKLVAKVDNAAVQDGFQLYLHAFIVADDGRWVVVQQGMQPATRYARRYHWLSDGVSDFVEEPHSAIEGEQRGEIINLTDRRSRDARARCLSLVGEGPTRVLGAVREATGAPQPERAPLLPHLQMPAHHDVRGEDVIARRLHGALAAAHEAAPGGFDDLLLTPGVGPRTVEALAMVSEVIHGAPSRFSDPARFSLAHGGKDGHPFPVPLEVYDRTLEVYRRAIEQAALGREEKLEALRRLARESRRLEHGARGSAVEAHIEAERRRSPELGGMSVLGPAGSGAAAQAPRRAPRKRKGQLDLPGL